MPGSALWFPSSQSFALRHPAQTSHSARPHEPLYFFLVGSFTLTSPSCRITATCFSSRLSRLWNVLVEVAVINPIRFASLSAFSRVCWAVSTRRLSRSSRPRTFQYFFHSGDAISTFPFGDRKHCGRPRGSRDTNCQHYAKTNRPLGFGMGRPSSFAVSIHS